MMFLKGLLYLFLAPFVLAKADLNRGVASHFDWTMAKIYGDQKCIKGPPVYPGERNDIAELCMTQLCGPSHQVNDPSELSISLMNSPSFYRELSATLLEFNQGINSLLEATDEERILTVEAYNDLKKRNDLQPDPQFLRLHDLTAITVEFSKTAFTRGPNKDQPLILDKAETQARLKDLPIAQREWAVQALDHFTRSKIGRTMLLKGMVPPKEYFRMAYPGLNFQEALRKEALEVKRTVNDLLSGPQASAVEMIASGAILRDPVIQKAIDGEILTEAEVDRFMNISSSAPLFWDVMTPSSKGGGTILTADSSREKVSEFLSRTQFDQRIRKYQADLSNAEEYKAVKQATFESCRSAYIFQMATLPTKKQLEQARDSGNWAKKRIKQVLNPILSKHTNQSLSSRINESFFAYPRDKESFHKFFMDQINTSISNTRSFTQNYKKLLDTGRHKTITLLKAHANPDGFTLEGHFNDVTDLCEEFKIKMVSDHVRLSTGGIEVSWISTRQPNFGKSVMLHELGHVAYDHLNSKEASAVSRLQMGAVNECLANNHSGDALPGESYIDEDWSDLIAAKGNPDIGSITACSLVAQEDDRYADLDLKNSDKEDPHSSPLFRALLSYKAIKGSLPSACIQFLANEKEPSELKTCF